MSELSLTELVADLASGLDDLGNQQRTLDRLRVLQQLDEVVGELATQASSWSNLVAVGRGAGFGAPEADSAVLAALATAQAVEIKADGEAQGQERRRRAIAAVTTALRESVSMITTAWREHVASAAPGARGLEALAKAFAEVPAAAARARELQAVLIELNAMPLKPPNAASADRLRALSAQVPELLAFLVGDDPEVRAFANSLARGGAAVDQITPGVLAWMTSAGFAGSFKVVAGQPVVSQRE